MPADRTVTTAEFPMRDLAFSLGMLVLTVGVVVLYGVRLLVRGRARHERTEKDGGSIFVGKGFMEMGYWLAGPLVAALDRAGFTANAVTLASLVPATAAAVAVANGWFGLACVLATGASFCDLLDGLLAKRQGSSSDAGEALDAMIDRYVELLFMGGLVVYYRTSVVLCVLSLLAALGAFAISYSTAKAEALGVPPPRGSMRRAERAIYLLFAAGLTPFAGALVGPGRPQLLREAPMILAVALIAVVANISAARRLRAIMDAIRVRDTCRAQLADAAPPAGASAGVPMPAPGAVAPNASTAVTAPRLLTGGGASLLTTVDKVRG